MTSKDIWNIYNYADVGNLLCRWNTQKSTYLDRTAYNNDFNGK